MYLLLIKSTNEYFKSLLNLLSMSLISYKCKCSCGSTYVCVSRFNIIVNNLSHTGWVAIVNTKFLTFGFRLPKSTFSIAKFDFKAIENVSTANNKIIFPHENVI